MMKNQTNRGFTLLELMVVITIIAILATMTMPAMNGWVVKAKMMKGVNNQKQIFYGLRTFASDNDGSFPFAEDGEDSEFSNSTDAYDYLLRETDVTEELFYVAGNPEKKITPNLDGELTPNENCMVYVMGMTDTSSATAPLVADEMESAGSYGENHPWLKNKKAIVTYVGGATAIEKLDSKSAGAKVRKGIIEDIFQPSEEDEDGKRSGGLLPPNISLDAVLLPGS